MLNLIKFFCSNSQLRINREGFHLKQYQVNFFPLLRTHPSNINSHFLEWERNCEMQFDEAIFTHQWQGLFGESGVAKKDKNRFLDVILPDVWVRHFLVQFPENARSTNDCMAAASKRFEILYGDDVSDWCLRPDFQFNGKNLVCAIPKKLQLCLEKNANLNGQRLLSIQSNFVQLWNAKKYFRLVSGWALICSEESALLAIVDKYGWSHVRQIFLPTHPNVEWLQTWMEKEVTMLNMKSPEIFIIDGDIPSIWKGLKFNKSSTPTIEKNAVSRVL